MHWNEVVEKVMPSVVRIETTQGHGTGFLCFFNDKKTVFGIATAWHVIKHADKWQEPIFLTNAQNGKSAMAPASTRVVHKDPKNDSAVILLNIKEIDLGIPETALSLRDTDKKLAIGLEVGWLGFPGIVDIPCFFAGTVSAWYATQNAYLIDGVAINGGPVVFSDPADGVQIVGTLAAYIPNRASAEPMPGLSMAQDVSHFTVVYKYVQSVDEARRQKEAEQLKQLETKQEEQNQKDAPAAQAAPATSEGK